MQVFPVVSSVNGATVAASRTDQGAYALVGAVNRHASNPVLVHVGKAVKWDGESALVVGGVKVPVNPPMGGKSDPNKIVLGELVKLAAKRTTGKTAPVKATPVKAATVKAAPKTAAKAATGKTATRTATRATVTGGARRTAPKRELAGANA